jgi:hypothetical protein
MLVLEIWITMLERHLNYVQFVKQHKGVANCSELFYAMLIPVIGIIPRFTFYLLPQQTITK